MSIFQQRPRRTLSSVKRQRTRARLIQAAIDAVADRGFQRSSLDEIAARAGVTKGSVYSNFKSKEDLFLAVAEAMKLGYSPKLADGMTVRELFRSLGEAVADSLAHAQAQANFLAEYHLLATADPRMRRRLAKTQEASILGTTEMIPRSITAAELPLPPPVLAAVIQALALGLIHQHLLTPRLITREVVLAAFNAIGRASPESRAAALAVPSVRTPLARSRSKR
jgi:AcrR family transcriptional regulator